MVGVKCELIVDLVIRVHHFQSNNSQSVLLIKELASFEQQNLINRHSAKVDRAHNLHQKMLLTVNFSYFLCGSPFL